MSKKKYLDEAGLQAYHEGVLGALNKKAGKHELPKIVQSITEDTDKNAVPTVEALAKFTDETYVRKDSAIDSIELEELLS